MPSHGRRLLLPCTWLLMIIGMTTGSGGSAARHERNVSNKYQLRPLMAAGEDGVSQMSSNGDDVMTQPGGGEEWRDAARAGSLALGAVQIETGRCMASLCTRLSGWALLQCYNARCRPATWISTGKPRCAEANCLGGSTVTSSQCPPGACPNRVLGNGGLDGHNDDGKEIVGVSDVGGVSGYDDAVSGYDDDVSGYGGGDSGRDGILRHAWAEAILKSGSGDDDEGAGGVWSKDPQEGQEYMGDMNEQEENEGEVGEIEENKKGKKWGSRIKAVGFAKRLLDSAAVDESREETDKRWATRYRGASGALEKKWTSREYPEPTITQVRRRQGRMDNLDGKPPGSRAESTGDGLNRQFKRWGSRIPTGITKRWGSRVMSGFNQADKRWGSRVMNGFNQADKRWGSRVMSGFNQADKRWGSRVMSGFNQAGKRWGSRVMNGFNQADKRWGSRVMSGFNQADKKWGSRVMNGFNQADKRWGSRVMNGFNQAGKRWDSRLATSFSSLAKRPRNAKLHLQALANDQER